MRRSALAYGLLASVALTSPVMANDDVKKATADPNNWAMQPVCECTSAHRASSLKFLPRLQAAANDSVSQPSHGSRDLFPCPSVGLRTDVLH